MELGLECELNRIDIRIRLYNDFFTISAVSPIKVKDDPAKRKEMSEFIRRANYGLILGGFQYDLRDGEILYRVSVPCQNIIPSHEMIEYGLCISAGMFEEYTPGILGILFAGASAKDAVASCEKACDQSAELSGIIDTETEN